MDAQFIRLTRSSARDTVRERLLTKPVLPVWELDLMPPRHAANEWQSFADIQLPNLRSTILGRLADIDVGRHAILTRQPPMKLKIMSVFVDRP